MTRWAAARWSGQRKRGSHGGWIPIGDYFVALPARAVEAPRGKPYGVGPDYQARSARAIRQAQRDREELAELDRKLAELDHLLELRRRGES